MSEKTPFSSYKGQEPYIFISYSHKNSAIVYPFISGLYYLGYRMWYDEGINPGSEWPEAIGTAIAKCDLMIVFLSSDAVKSINVRNEINFARSKGKMVLCIYIEETELTDGLALQIGSSQGIKAYKIQDMERFRERLLASLPERTKEKRSFYKEQQIRALYIIFEEISSQMSAYFSNMFQTFCEVSVISVEEQIFTNFINSFPSPILLMILNLAPLQGSIIMSIWPSVAYGILNWSFGGTGKPGESNRMFTEIEIAVLERILRQSLPMMAGAWEKIVKVDPIFKRIETDIQFAQIAKPREATTIITMQFKTAEIDGLIKFCIPNIVIEPIAKQLAAVL